MKYCCILHGRVCVMVLTSDKADYPVLASVTKPTTMLKLVIRTYRKVPLFPDERKRCCNLPKIHENMPNLWVFSQKDANGIANSGYPDQTAPIGAV